jgi:aspartyl-tRNA(Asn)/glutamyl-tRNA(Gln) amidotransferase subunit C
MPERRHDFAVRHVASLARLKLTGAEEGLYARQLGDILAYATQLLEIAGVSDPSVPAAREPSVLRQDRVRPSVARAIVLDSAPDCSDDQTLFRVPRVIG